ncbi:MAG: TIGR02646 family protein [Sulfurimonas sp.]|jgi:uncharacterized protein (TIGR02646 family)|nr:TIGR02646 family protein [Sulfurimonas sp.]
MHKLNRPTELTELAQARRTYTGTISQDEAWKNFGDNGERTKVREQLENTQNYLCAYCENTLANDGHIDHFKPKSLDWRVTFDWDNLVVSCTYNDSCGKKKDNDFEFYWLNPYSTDPEEMFKFYANGQIRGTSADAENIIKDFGLDCPRLEKKRNGILESYQKVLLDLATEQPDALEYFLQAEESPFPTAHKQILNEIIGA